MVGAGLALALLVIGLLAADGWAARGEFRFDIVDCTGTASHVAASNSARRSLTLQNVGTANVYLGSSGGPARLTAANGLTLHAGSAITFSAEGDPTVQVECITDGGGQRMQRIEEN